MPNKMPNNKLNQINRLAKPSSKLSNLRNLKPEQRNIQKSIELQQKFKKFGINENTFNQNNFLFDLTDLDLHKLLSAQASGSQQLARFSQENRRLSFGMSEKLILILTLMFLTTQTAQASQITFTTPNMGVLNIHSQNEKPEGSLFLNQREVALINTGKTIGNTHIYPIYSNGKDEYIAKPMTEPEIIKQSIISVLFPYLTNYPNLIKASPFRLGKIKGQWTYLNQILKPFLSVDQMTFTVDSALHVLELLRVSSILGIGDLHDGNFGLTQQDQNTIFVLVDADTLIDDRAQVLYCFSLYSVFSKIPPKYWSEISSKIDHFFSVKTPQNRLSSSLILEKISMTLDQSFWEKHRSRIEKQVNDILLGVQSKGRYVIGKNLIDQLVKSLINIPKQGAKDFVLDELERCFGSYSENTIHWQ